MTEIELKRMYAAYKAKQVAAEQQVAQSESCQVDNAAHYTNEHLEAMRAIDSFDDPADFIRVAVRN